MNKLALGTVQFGLAYGINNSRGKILPQEVGAILSTAAAAGVDTLDTAHGYGNSEEIIGQCVDAVPNVFKIVTKLPDGGCKGATQCFEQSLQRLKQQSVYGLLIHHFNEFEKDPDLWGVVRGFKDQGLVQKIGFSLYYPNDLEKLFEKSVAFDLIQVPYSIFDRRFEPYLGILKDKGVEVHVRSVFLQGLIFKKPEDLTGRFLGLRLKIESLNKLADRHRIPVWALALNFAVLNEHIDKVIVGVDGLNHLKSLLQGAQFFKNTNQILEDLQKFQENDEQVILPVNWK